MGEAAVRALTTPARRMCTLKYPKHTTLLIIVHMTRTPAHKLRTLLRTKRRPVQHVKLAHLGLLELANLPSVRIHLPHSHSPAQAEC